MLCCVDCFRCLLVVYKCVCFSCLLGVCTGACRESEGESERQPGREREGERGREGEREREIWSFSRTEMCLLLVFTRCLLGVYNGMFIYIERKKPDLSQPCSRTKIPPRA